MRAKFELMITKFVCFIAVSSVQCEVFVRDINSIEGSVCFMTDKKRGVCRSECPGQEKFEYESNVCSRNGSLSLYCCIDKERSSLYPTIDKVCINQRLEEEFYKRGQLEAAALERKLKESREQYNEHFRQVERECYQSSLGKDEDERQEYLKKCLTIPKRATLSMFVVSLAKVTYFPYVVGLGYDDSNDWYEWTCAGSLVHEEYVLTSASCVLNSTKPPTGVLVGVPHLRYNSLQYQVKEILIHENHTAGSFYHDVAILKVKMSPNRRKNERAIPVCLWTKREFPTDDLLALGFSDFSNGLDFKIKPSLEAAEACERNFKDELQAGMANSQICVRVSEGKNPCQGGFGGPLHFTVEDWVPITYLVGFASLGQVCTGGKLGVYTRIHPYLEWIERIISGGK